MQDGTDDYATPERLDERRHERRERHEWNNRSFFDWLRGTDEDEQESDEELERKKRREKIDEELKAAARKRAEQFEEERRIAENRDTPETKKLKKRWRAKLVEKSQRQLDDAASSPTPPTDGYTVAQLMVAERIVTLHKMLTSEDLKRSERKAIKLHIDFMGLLSEKLSRPTLHVPKEIEQLYQTISTTVRDEVTPDSPAEPSPSAREASTISDQTPETPPPETDQSPDIAPTAPPHPTTTPHVVPSHPATPSGETVDSDTKETLHHPTFATAIIRAIQRATTRVAQSVSTATQRTPTTPAPPIVVQQTHPETPRNNKRASTLTPHPHQPVTVTLSSTDRTPIPSHTSPPTIELLRVIQEEALPVTAIRHELHNTKTLDYITHAVEQTEHNDTTAIINQPHHNHVTPEQTYARLPEPHRIHTPPPIKPIETPSPPTYHTEQAPDITSPHVRTSTVTEASAHTHNSAHETTETQASRTVPNIPIERWSHADLLRQAQVIPIGGGSYLAHAYQRGDIDRAGMIKILKTYMKGGDYRSEYTRRSEAYRASRLSTESPEHMSTSTTQPSQNPPHNNPIVPSDTSEPPHGNDAPSPATHSPRNRRIPLPRLPHTPPLNKQASTKLLVISVALIGVIFILILLLGARLQISK